MRFIVLLNAVMVLSTILTCAQTTIKVKINQPPKLSLVTESDTSVLKGESIDLGKLNKVTGGTLPYSYLWSPDETLDDGSIQNPVATPPERITYYVVVTDYQNCTAKDSIRISVVDGINNLSEVSSGIVIYPIPVTNGILFVKLININKPLNFTILDLNGSIIKNGIIPEAESNAVVQLPLSVKSGTYILKIDYDNKSVAKQFTVIYK